ncbi:MAG: FG-GAP-like repeat-containing protein, partial [Candidatus Woesearchaeota archaeon]
MFSRAKVTTLFAIILFIALFGFLFYQSSITGYAVVEGNATAVGVSVLKIKINGSDDLSHDYHETLPVEFYDLTTPIAKFEWDFSKGPLPLSQVSIESVRGELAFNGINVPKILFVERRDSTHVCIIDSDGASILDFTDDCSGESELLVACDGELYDGYNCSVFDDLFRVSGLMHSAIKAIKVESVPEEQPEPVAEIRDESNKLVGKKITDEPSFETHFVLVEKTSESLNLVFYHDAATSQAVWIEGDVNYTLSHSVAMPYENVTLSVLLVKGIVPKFKVHVGSASEVFEFGKEIPDVSFEGEYRFIDRDDELIDVELTAGFASVLIKGTSEPSITAKIDSVPDAVITTPVFASEITAMEEAVITLPKNGVVSAVLECPDFDVNTFTCPSSWQDSGIPFTETDTHITFTVNHFSGYGGGNISVINVQSYPTLNGNWTVAFNTTGTEDLTITGFNGTSFTTDLDFLELRCGNETLNATYDGTTVFYANYSCNDTGYETVRVKTAGKHTQQFTFGNSTAYAYNIVVTGIQNVTSVLNATYYSEADTDSAGFAMAAGDVNGDGNTDFIIGAPNRNDSNRSYNGKVYLVYGNFTNNTKTNLSNANASWIGAHNFSFAGNSLATGDFNNDSLKDIVIGSYGDDTSGNSRSGSVYVIYGGSLSGNKDLINPASFNILITGKSANGNAGWKVAAGDLNGDGIDDLVLSELEPFTGPGHVYVFFSPLLSGPISLANVILNGSYTAEHFGQSLAIGDLNNDTYNDLIIGADNYSVAPPPLLPRPGAAFVFYGPLASGTSLLDVNANVTFMGENHDDRAGFSLSSRKDASGDGIHDLLIGAPLYDSPSGTADVGKAYLIYGDASLNGTINLNTGANASWYGEAKDDYLGYSVLLSFEDNGTIADAMIGAPGQDYGGTNAGRIYFLYNPSPASSGIISSAANGSLYGSAAGVTLGSSMASGSMGAGAASMDISLFDNYIEPSINTIQWIYLLGFEFPKPPPIFVSPKTGGHRDFSPSPPEDKSCYPLDSFKVNVNQDTGVVGVKFGTNFDATKIKVAVFAGFAGSFNRNTFGSFTKTGENSYSTQFVVPKDILNNEPLLHVIITDAQGRLCGDYIEYLNPCATQEQVTREWVVDKDFWDYLDVDYTSTSSNQLVYLA